MPSPDDRTLLVVEDDHDLRETLCDALGYEGVVCEPARTGWQAIEMLRSGLRPRAILLDLRMPEMNGLEFLQKQRTEASAIRKIPVIVLTGDRHGPEAARLGAAAVLDKPVNVDTLLATLKPFLETSS